MSDELVRHFRKVLLLSHRSDFRYYPSACQLLALGEFEADSKRNYVDLRRTFLLDMSRSTKRLFFRLSLSKLFIGTDTHCLSVFVYRDPEDFYDCCVSEFADHHEVIHCLDSNERRFSLPPAFIDHFTKWLLSDCTLSVHKELAPHKLSSTHVTCFSLLQNSGSTC